MTDSAQVCQPREDATFATDDLRAALSESPDLMILWQIVFNTGQSFRTYRR
jgi:hypothetical protein